MIAIASPLSSDNVARRGNPGATVWYRGDRALRQGKRAQRIVKVNDDVLAGFSWARSGNGRPG
jgi:hypothetical protein